MISQAPTRHFFKPVRTTWLKMYAKLLVQFKPVEAGLNLADVLRATVVTEQKMASNLVVKVQTGNIAPKSTHVSVYVNNDTDGHVCLKDTARLELALEMKQTDDV